MQRKYYTMKELKERILKEGHVITASNTVKVGSFLNHQLDPELLMHCAEEFVRLFKNYYLGISFIGIAAFVIQEIPYIVMPLINPASNPIMNMQNEIEWIEMMQGIFGMLSMIMLMLIVRDDVKLIPLVSAEEKVCFSLTVFMMLESRKNTQ